MFVFSCLASRIVIEDHAQGVRGNYCYLTWSSSSATQKSQSALRPLGSSFPAIALNLSARLSAIATVSLSTNIRSPLSFGGLSPLFPYNYKRIRSHDRMQVKPYYKLMTFFTRTLVRPNPKHLFGRPYHFLLGDPNTVLLLARVSTLVAVVSGVGLLIDWLVSFLTGGLPRRAYPRYLYTVLGDMHICGGACG